MTLKRLLLYSGYNKRIFDNINKTAIEFDKKVWRVMSIVSIVLFGIMTIFSMKLGSFEKNRLYYSGIGSISILFALLFWTVGKKNNIVHQVLMYVFCACIMGGIIAISTYNTPNEKAVSFTVLLIVLPVLITDRPINVGGFILLSYAVFIIMALCYEDKNTFVADAVYATIFMLLSLVINTYTLAVKYSNYKLYMDAHNRARRDTLTGLGNETAYFEKVEEIEAKIKNNEAKFAVVIMDVNNVKNTNDAYGHRFGCHLIVTGGKTLPKIFKNSAAFHIGGDEFVVIVEGDNVDKLDDCIKKFDEGLAYKVINYNGVDIILSLARGYRVYESGMKYKDVFQDADDAMYANKKMIKEKYNIKGR